MRVGDTPYMRVVYGTFFAWCTVQMAKSIFLAVYFGSRGGASAHVWRRPEGRVFSRAWLTQASERGRVRVHERNLKSEEVCRERRGCAVGDLKNCSCEDKRETLGGCFS